jgi:cardiolipin synthase A/B
MSGKFSDKAPFYSVRNRVKLVHGGAEYFSVMADMIRQARNSIHLQTYIYDDDETGIMIGEELIAASRRGVKTFVLLDGYASRQLSSGFIEQLTASGIHFRFFEPVMKSKSFYFGRRLHHKILVTDNRYSLVGGINISNRYNDMPGEPAWLDWAVHAEGEVSYELFKVCIEFWYRSPKQARAAIAASPPISFPHEWDCSVKVRRNDWVRRRNQISRSYIEMFNRAENEIIIMSSYFLPGRVMRRNMVQAAKRGVNISLILAGTSDVAMSKYAERFIYRWMLRNKVKIYEYPKSVLHAKLSTYDGKWVTVGSYNVNDISAYASIELNLDVMDGEFAGEVTKWMNRTIEKDCIRITDDYIKQYNLVTRFLQWWSYEVFRAILFAFTFYFRQKED